MRMVIFKYIVFIRKINLIKCLLSSHLFYNPISVKPVLSLHFLIILCWFCTMTKAIDVKFLLLLCNYRQLLMKTSIKIFLITPADDFLTFLKVRKISLHKFQLQWWHVACKKKSCTAILLNDFLVSRWKIQPWASSSFNLCN